MNCAEISRSFFRKVVVFGQSQRVDKKDAFISQRVDKIDATFLWLKDHIVMSNPSSSSSSISSSQYDNVLSTSPVPNTPYF